MLAADVPKLRIGEPAIPSVPANFALRGGGFLLVLPYAQDSLAKDRIAFRDAEPTERTKALPGFVPKDWRKTKA